MSKSSLSSVASLMMGVIEKEEKQKSLLKIISESDIAENAIIMVAHDLDHEIMTIVKKIRDQHIGQTIYVALDQGLVSLDEVIEKWENRGVIISLETGYEKLGERVNEYVKNTIHIKEVKPLNEMTHIISSRDMDSKFNREQQKLRNRNFNKRFRR